MEEALRGQEQLQRKNEELQRQVDGRNASGRVEGSRTRFPTILKRNFE